MPTPAELWQQRQRQVTDATAAAVVRAWARVRMSDPQRTFEMVLPELLATVTAGQLAAATGADLYVAAVVRADGLSPEPVASVAPRRFAGVVSDGRPLVGLLTQPLLRSLYLRTRGADDATALAGGRESLRTLVRTEIFDTGRDATSVAIGLDRKVTGYIRQVNLPSCDRCIVLAGRFYRKSAGFSRHPRCFPAGVVVSGPGVDAATRRWYQGELVVLTTASGQNLPLTGNHPVLTSRGWVPANLLHEGDEVVRSTRPEGAHSLVVPDHHEVPSRIEDVWGSLGMAGFDTVEAAPEDFHGDGQHGQVDVVRAHRSLDRGHLSTLDEHASQGMLSYGPGSTLVLDGQCPPVLLDLGEAPHPRRLVSSAGLSLPFVGSHLRHPDEAGFAVTTTLHAGTQEALRYEAPRDAVLTGQAVLAGPSLIGLDDVVFGDVAEVPRWDAPGLAFGVETLEGYARVGRDLFDRLAGQVELDRVVEVRRTEWSGHVYSLTSVEGWHSANNLIVSNCDCSMKPQTRVVKSGEVDQEPRKLFDGMTAAQQDKAFGQVNAEVIRRGGDIGQVVNARRGMATAGDNWTTAGASSRNARPSPGGLLRSAGDDPDTFARALERAGYL